jgi:hypothetical protein
VDWGGKAARPDGAKASIAKIPAKFYRAISVRYSDFIGLELSRP